MHDLFSRKKLCKLSIQVLWGPSSILLFYSGLAGSTEIDLLQKLRKRAARFILMASSMHQAGTLLRSWGLLLESHRRTSNL